nr:MAG TPA: hypothetical protein [Caudoviricetes sp.]
MQPTAPGGTPSPLSVPSRPAENREVITRIFKLNFSKMT